MGGCLAAEVGADRRSNMRRVNPSYRGGLGSRHAAKRDLASTADLGRMAQVTRVGLGRDGMTYGGGRRRSLLPRSAPTSAAKQPSTRP
ncbi:hypothetical protein V6N11_067789 [Hibiscus sabdariffa]|uniref:Uncharacterized protein n=1 Tax=Hibiscus sabdariffa TaxID=183260 RepID=A0ABR2SRT2_9ROSI